MLCSVLKVNARFEGTFRFHLQGWRVSQESSQQGHSLAHLAPYFLLCVLLDSEGAGDMLFFNIGLSPIFTALQPRRLCFSWLCVSATLYIYFKDHKLEFSEVRYLSLHWMLTSKRLLSSGMWHHIVCLAGRYRCFGRICYLIFYLENVLWNGSTFLADYTVWHFRRQWLSYLLLGVSHVMQHI
jgi:hypothetical protein